MCLKKWLFPAAAACSGVLALLLLTCGNTAAQGVRDGISLCLASVIPALFPFFVAAQLLTALGAAEVLGRAAGPLFRRLFCIDGAGAAAFLLGLLGRFCRLRLLLRRLLGGLGLCLFLSGLLGFLLLGLLLRVLGGSGLLGAVQISAQVRLAMILAESVSYTHLTLPTTPYV